MMDLFILIILINKILIFYIFIFNVYLNLLKNNFNQLNLCYNILTPNVRRRIKMRAKETIKILLLILLKLLRYLIEKFL